MLAPVFTVLPARRARTAAVAAVAVLGLLLVTPYAQARPGPESFAELAAKVKPAVVNISTTMNVAADQEEMAESPDLGIPPGSPFEEFLRRFYEMQPGAGAPERRPREVQALGSGFIVDPEGYVVTNNHVVGKADKTTVTLADGRKFDAKIIGRDEKTDLALLKVKTDKPLPFVGWGDSDKAQVGDWVLAVGNPFGLGGTVTAGIISARGRDIQSGPFDDYIQIDAPINRGNSGGPSFDQDGHVIGVNSAIFSPNGGSVGIGFAIPSSLAKPIVAQLRESGRVERGWLGVQIQPVTPEIAASLGLDEAKGAIVAKVSPNSPAALAGVQQGDVVLTFNGKEIAEVRDLPRLVANAHDGENAALEVVHNGAKKTLDVKIGRMPQGEQVAATDDDMSGGTVKSSRVLGLNLAPVTPETRRRLGLAEKTGGVLVANVAAGSEAAE
ncbi:MAG: Do family serine endopeptidase, partial [Proteobacteria bacterium]|nr:Do family serine endopeptidase [Pseudomonadota bacterium]